MKVIDVNGCDCVEHLRMRAIETQGILIGMHYALSLTKDESRYAYLNDDVINEIRASLETEHSEPPVRLKLVDSPEAQKDNKLK